MLTFIRAHRQRITTGLMLAGLLGLGAAQVYDHYYGDCCQPGAACCHPGSPCCHHGDQVATR